MTRGTTAAALIAGLALVLAGCSGGKPSAKASDEPGPLQKYWEQALGYDANQSEADWQAQFDQQNKVYQEVIATCMTEQGFEYYPDDTGATMVVADSQDDSGPQWGTVAFAKLYGYGAIDSPEMAEASQEPEDEATYTPSKNEEYVNSMTDSEREAYYTALHGEQPDWESMTKEEQETFEWQPGGCEAKANEAAYGNSMAGQDDDSPYADLEQAMSDLWTTAQNDPRQQTLDASWASCMADNGHTGFANPTEAQQSIYDELNDLYQELSNDPDWNGDLPPADKKSIQEKEISLATADFGCQEKLKYTDEQLDIMRQIEQEFVDQHKSELDAWAQWMAQQREASATPGSDTTT